MKPFLMVVTGLAIGATTAGAQGLSAPRCASTGGASQNVSQDACQQAYDVYQYLAPQLGIALAGGNATLGQASTLGGLGHFSLGARVNVVQGTLPTVEEFRQRTSGASPAVELPTSSQLLPLPTADLAIGLFAGLPLALTNVGGVDLLLSATYIPEIGDATDDVTVTPKSNIQLGYGARVGLLSESILVPGVSLTYLRRDLPRTAITGRASYTSLTTGTTTTDLRISDTKVNTSSWRIVASKSLLFFGIAAGVGQDKLDQAADISATVTSTLGGSSSTSIPQTSQSLTRTNYFLDATMSLLLFKLTAEIGQSSGGTVDTFNSFEGGRADRSRNYGSLGIRFGF